MNFCAYSCNRQTPVLLEQGVIGVVVQGVVGPVVLAELVGVPWVITVLPWVRIRNVCVRECG